LKARITSFLGPSCINNRARRAFLVDMRLKFSTVDIAPSPSS
jgi:hypothetical protein